MKQRLLVVELWGLGDLIIASPFLKAAAEKYDVTLLAQAHAAQLRPHLWPDIRCIAFKAPWTAHVRKYRLYRWPWRRIIRLWRVLRHSRFDVGVAGRWDPRDHVILWLAGAKRRVGYPRAGSKALLTEPVSNPDALAHRYERWRRVGGALGLAVPDRGAVVPLRRQAGREVVLHSGAGKAIRVWPLERFGKLASRLRAAGLVVSVACDPDQVNWWREHGEPDVAVPTSIDELMGLFQGAGLFVGNDSGPGHLAGYLGIPTLTIFGPQVPEWFCPIHPEARWIGGSACPFLPCSDYCRFPEPMCLTQVGEEAVWNEVRKLVQEHLNHELAA